MKGPFRESAWTKIDPILSMVLCSLAVAQENCCWEHGAIEIWSSQRVVMKLDFQSEFALLWNCKWFAWIELIKFIKKWSGILTLVLFQRNWTHCYILRVKEYWYFCLHSARNCSTYHLGSSNTVHENCSEKLPNLIQKGPACTPYYTEISQEL